MPFGSEESTDEAPFDHPRRELIYELVNRQPGLNWNQIKRKTGLSAGTLLFHLDKLEDAGEILRRDSTSDKEILFFTEDNVEMWRDPSTRVLFGNDATRNVARAIDNNPGASIQEIADEVGIHYVTVRYHLDKLKDHKLLIEDKDGRRKIYEPTNRLSEWIHDFGEEVDPDTLPDA